MLSNKHQLVQHILLILNPVMSIENCLYFISLIWSFYFLIGTAGPVIFLFCWPGLFMFLSPWPIKKIVFILLAHPVWSLSLFCQLSSCRPLKVHYILEYAILIKLVHTEILLEISSANAVCKTTMGSLGMLLCVKT